MHISSLPVGVPHHLFRGKHVTGYFEVEGLLKQQGGLRYDKGESGKPFVVTDGNLITGRDPVSAELFGKTVVETLRNSPSK